MVAQTSQAAEKLKYLSFRGALRAEESHFLGFKQREIPRFALSDKIKSFFRSLFSLWVSVSAWLRATIRRCPIISRLPGTALILFQKATD